MGIGTNNPNTKLHIEGDAKISDILLIGKPGGQNTFNRIDFANGGWGFPQAYINEISSPSSGTKIKLYHANNNYNSIGMDLNGNMWFRTGADQKSGYHFYTASNNAENPSVKFSILNNGRVGIGLSNPHSKLTIGNGNLSVREGHIIVETENVGVSSSDNIGNSYRFGLFRGNLLDDNHTHYEQHSLGYLEFTRYGGWGSIAKLHIGRVWGGTQQQEVFMAQVFDDPTGYPNQSSHISFNTDQVNNSAVLYVGKGSSSTNTRHSAIFENNVGIGKTPVHKLDVSGSIDATQYYVNGQAINFNNAVTSVWGQSGTTVNYVGGNVGIGTATPSYSLDVTGTLNASEIRINGQILDLASANLWDASGNDIQYNSGKVGINTTNLVGDYSLFVKDGIITEKVVVEVEGEWPDYVFSSTYQLPTLKEVAHYIQEHQHLPEIPSAKEIEKDGLNLGEMEALMMKKIEELTLYAIEQERKVEDFGKENIELKNEVLELREENKSQNRDIQELKTIINQLQEDLTEIKGKNR